MWKRIDCSRCSQAQHDKLERKGELYYGSGTQANKLMATTEDDQDDPSRQSGAALMWRDYEDPSRIAVYIDNASS